MAPNPDPFVSRGGLKLAAALDAFGLDPRGLRCADLGCNVGGFTDCLLQRGAAHVFAVDTSYGTLAWKLRNDPRVTVLERRNALHLDPRSALDAAASDAGNHACDLVVIDLGWTRQRLALPAAIRWLRVPRPDADDRADDRAEDRLAGCSPSPRPAAPRIITLIKPHYEHDPGLDGPIIATADETPNHRHILPADLASRVLRRVLDTIPAMGLEVLAHRPSPILGGGSRGGHGNIEYLALLAPARPDGPTTPGMS